MAFSYANIKDDMWRTGIASYATIASSGRWHPYAWCRDLARRIQPLIIKGDARIIINAPPRHGKLAADNMPIWTPDRGLIQHGELAAGDFVFGPDGEPTRIISVSEPGFADTRIIFSDGSKIDCHHNHEWFVFDRSPNVRDFRVYETNYFINRKVLDKCKNGYRSKYLLDNAPCLQFEEQKNIMDPYVLGAWIGDGSIGKPCITQDRNDTEVFDYLSSVYRKSATHIHKTTGVITSSFAGNTVNGKLSEFRSHLVEIGVDNFKHIPRSYIYTSIKDRLRLLAGLIDTDGNVCKKTGRVRYSTTSKDIRDGVFELVTTLGMRPYVSETDACISSSGIIGRKTVYQVGFQPTMEIPTLIPRKKINIIAKRRRIGIVKVESISPIPGKCIQVDREDGLYIIGEKGIVTHNSELISHWFPTWYIDTWPWKRIILTSNTADLASDLSGRVRDELESNRLCRTKPRFDTRARASWKTSESGGIKSAGAGGDIVGRGSDTLIIDDPFRSIEDAMSKTVRTRIIDWFLGTAYHRLEPHGNICLIQTRWHENDLSGFLINEHDEEWTVLRYPALADSDDDLLGREFGEPLCPERWPLDAIERKKSMGSYLFAGIYQQRPAPLGGGMVKDEWFKYWEYLPEKIDEWIQSWDLTFKETGSSYACGQVWAKSGANYYLVDQIRGKMGFLDQVSAIVDMSHKWPQAITKIIEDAADAQAVKDTLKNSVSGITLIPARGSKEANLSAVVGVIESGNVYIPKSAPWVGDFRLELTSFPTSSNDDQVDCLSHALKRLVKNTQYDIAGITIPTAGARASQWGAIG